MKNCLRTVLLALLFAALPLRAAASVTAVFCVAAGHDAPAQVHSHAHDAEDGGAAHDDEQPPGTFGHKCGYCAKHCSGASYVLPADGSPLAAAAPSDPIPFGARPNLGFVPEHPERPPLAL